MFCSSCGKMIDDDAIFCPACGKKIKRIPQDETFSPTGKVSLEKTTDIPITEDEPIKTPENNEQTEFSQEETQPEEVASENNKNFFGSVEPISHISANPVTESSPKVSETHSRESLPDLVLRKKSEEQSDISQEDSSSQENNQPYDDNSNTQYIPYEELKESLDDIPPEYNDDVPPYNQPEFPQEQPYYPPPPPPPMPAEEYKPVKVGFLRLFSAGFITFITMIFVILLSLLFCIKLGFSGATLEKSIKKLDTEKILEAEYDSNHDVNEFLYEKSDFYNISLHSANENDFRNFILNLDMNSFIGENVAVYADYLLNNGKKPSLTSDKIAEYMFNKSTYNNLIKQDFSTMIYNLTDGNADEFLSVDEWKNTGFNFNILSYIFSYVTLGIFLVLIVVMFIWIAVIVDKRGRYVTGFYKNIFMVSGVILLIIGGVCVIAPPIVYSQTSHIVFYLSSKLLTSFNMFTLATGGFEVIVGIILGLTKKLIIRHERKNRDFL